MAFLHYCAGSIAFISFSATVEPGCTRILRLELKHSLPEKAKTPDNDKTLKPGYTTTLQCYYGADQITHAAQQD